MSASSSTAAPTAAGRCDRSDIDDWRRLAQARAESRQRFERRVERVVWSLVLLVASACGLVGLTSCLGGCAGAQVGPNVSDAGGIGPGGTFTQNTPSPNVLSITDADKRGHATGTGPAQFTSLNADGLQTMKTGSTPREVFFDRDTGRFVVSSGADLSAKGITFDAATGSLSVEEFSTSASEPIRALNESLDRLAAVWVSMTEAERDAVINESNNIRATLGDLLAAAIKAALAGGTGIPAP